MQIFINLNSHVYTSTELILLVHNDSLLLTWCCTCTIMLGSYARTSGIDRIVKEFIEWNKIQCHDRPCQIISLGAGSDARYFELKVLFCDPHLICLIYKCKTSTGCSTSTQIVYRNRFWSDYREKSNDYLQKLEA